MTEYVANEDCDLISVIVPAYNEEENIGKCLDSILNQTYKNIEIVVVYLESNDKTLDIIKSFSDDRVKIVYQPSKTGPGGARELGVQTSSGKFLGFVEADDRIPADYFERLYRALIENDADISMCEIVKIKNGKEWLWSEVENGKIVSKLSDKLRLMKHGATFDKLFRTNVVKDNDIHFTEHWRWEDNPWLLKVLYYSDKMVMVKGLEYRYYIEPSRSDAYEKFLNESVVPIASEMYNFAKEKDFSKKELKLLRKFIMKSFVGHRILDKDIYESLTKTIDGGFWLRFRRFKLQSRKFRKDIKNKIGEILCQKKS